MALFNYRGLSTDEIVELTALSNASYDGESPPAGWTTLTGATLGFVEGFGTGTYDGTTYIGSLGFLGAPAARAYSKGSELTISFRGTDGALDFATYLDIVGNNNYINAFNSFLDAVEGYVSDAANGITSINVVGHSLGAAAANILRNVSADKNDGFFNGATYFTVAAPKISSDPDILNIGFENDWVFESISRSTPFVSSDFFSATDNMVLFDDAYAADDWPGFLFDPSDTSAHSATGYIEAVQRIVDSTFYGEMVRDSVVIVSATNNQVSDKDVSTSDHFGQDAFFVGRAVADDILGGDAVDKVDAGAGNDRIEGGMGNDVIDGAEGTDTVVYGDDCSEYDITKNDDGTITIAHVRGDMEDGTDTLMNVEFAEFAGGEVDLTVDDPGCKGQDIAFVVDTTGSMADDIASVKSSATAIINAIFAPERGLTDSRIAVVGFNDPATSTVLTFTEQDTTDARKAAALAAINSLGASGGGDFPEAVYGGLLRALDGRAGEWREDAVARKIILFGDAPAKDTELRAQVEALARDLGVGISAPVTVEDFAVTAMNEDTSVAEFSIVSEAAAPLPVQIFAVNIGGNALTRADYTDIANFSGGAVFEATNAADLVTKILEVIELPIYSVSASATSIDEGNGGVTEITFTVSRDNAGGEVVVDLAFGGTADSADYTASATSVTLGDGVLSAEITVRVTGDTVGEPDEDISVSISGLSAAGTISTTPAVLLIRNDDGDTVAPNIPPEPEIEPMEPFITIGSEGDDIFGLNDFPIDGRGGTDTINTLGRYADHMIEMSPDGGFVITRPDGFEVAIQSIEKLLFEDAELMLVDDAALAGLNNLYQSYFDRDGEIEGLSFWYDELLKGAELGDVSDMFAMSTEFLDKFGENPTNAEIVDLAYSQLFEREADGPGRAFWVDVLDTGALDVPDVFTHFATSEEATGIYEASFGDGMFLIA